MSGQDKPKGGIASFSIGLGQDAPNAEAVSPPPPFRVLIAGDFGLSLQDAALNITGLDIAELLEQYKPAFTASADNLLGSLPSRLEERFQFATQKDLRPTALFQSFKFVRDVEEAGGEADRLATHGRQYDKVAEAMSQDRAPSPSQSLRSEPGSSAGEPETDGSDGLDSLFSMVDASGKKDRPEDGGSLAKAAVEAFVQKTMREERQKAEAPAAPKSATRTSAMLDGQSRAFFEKSRLGIVLKNLHGLKLLLSEISFSLPFELHLLQLDAGLSPQALEDLLGGSDGVLLQELYDVVLFANPVAIAGQDAELVKTVARECMQSDTLGFASLGADFMGVPAEQLVSMEAAHQLLDAPGFEAFRGLCESEAASHLALFWNEARLTSEEASYPALYASGAWIALIQVLAQVGTEVFPRLPVGVPSDFDALEVAEGRVGAKTVAMATRYAAGPGTAPSLAQCGINVLEGVANRTDLVFRRGVTTKPGKEGRGSIDQALLVSRLFSLFQEALGEAVKPDQTAETREVEVMNSLQALSASLDGQVAFQVKRMQVDDQDLINVSASVQGGWAAGQQHSFYLPAESG